MGRGPATPLFPPNATAAEAAAIKAAQDLPGLIAGLKAVDSPLADQLTGKGLVESKTPLVSLLVTGAAWASAKWGFGWSEEVDAEVAGMALVLISYLMRAISSVPITGLFGAKPVGGKGTTT